MTAVDLVRELAFPRDGIHSPNAGEDQACRETLVSSLEGDLQGARRSEALQGLCDMLGDDGESVLGVVLLLCRGGFSGYL